MSINQSNLFYLNTAFHNALFQSSFTEYNEVNAQNILTYSCHIIAILELEFCIEINICIYTNKVGYTNAFIYPNAYWCAII